MTHHSPGALHIHSVFSDGTGTLEEIARDARRAGLEWIGMTDHNTLAPTYRGFEGIHGGVVVIVGYEWTPDDGDHMLVYGEAAALGTEPLDPTLAPAEAIGILGNRGALTHIAHPDERRGVAMPSLPPYPWHDWQVRGMRGIELWNFMSEWAERLTPRNRLLHALLPGTGLRGPSDRVLRWWDDLNRPVAGAPFPVAHGGRVGAAEAPADSPADWPADAPADSRADAVPGPGGSDEPRFAGGARLTVGVSGTDAHAFRVRAFGRTWTIFPYLQVFRAFTNYLLLDEPLPADLEPARSAILRAIGEGRLYFANRRLGDALGLEFTAGDSGGRHVGSGGWLPWKSGGAQVRVASPLPASLRILRDGEEIARTHGRTLAADAPGPGSYRVEAWRFGEPWAFTNPIALLS